MSNTCIFCLMVNGQIKPEVVNEDSDFLVILDKYPQKEGHCLVIPKKHDEDFLSLSEDDFGKLMKKVYWLAGKLKVLSGCERVIVKLIGEDINHVHVHVVPSSYNNFDKSVLKFD